MKKNDEKKVALKLINQYADQYKRIEEENRSLKTEIIDMRTNLKINKEIIEGLFKGGDKDSLITNKLKEENSLLIKRGDNLTKENEGLRQKIVYYEKLINDSINSYRDSAETLQNKIFILENAIIKKDNLIINLNKKLNKMYDKYEIEVNEIEREVYIIEPNTSINLIHDDLMLYKQAYENLMQHIKENTNKIKTYEQEIKKLKTETGILRTQVDENSYMETEQGKYRTTTLERLDNRNVNKTDSFLGDLKNTSTKSNSETPNDWMTILKQANITSEEIDDLSDNLIFTKIIDAIEMMNEKLNEKSKQIKNINKENESLLKKNSALNKDNIILSKTIFELKKQNEHLKMKMEKDNNGNSNYECVNTNASMTNNTSRIEHTKNKKFNLMARLYDELDNPQQLNNSYQENLPVLTEGIDQAEKYLTECGDDEDENSIIEVDKDDFIIDEIKKSNVSVKKANNVYLINNNINNNYTTVKTGKLKSARKMNQEAKNSSSFLTKANFEDLDIKIKNI